MFDSVSHSILLPKLENYGIGDIAYSLISSYLQNQSESVSINQTRSEVKEIQIGVLQGSCLGPLFFLVYIHDLTNALNCKTNLFADDTCMTVQVTNTKTLEIKTNKAYINYPTKSNTKVKKL